MERRLAATALLLLVGAAAAEEQPDGWGAEAPSGSVFVTTIGGPDADDFVVDGYPGMRLRVKVTTGRRSGLVPDLQLLRPDGEVVEPEDGLRLRTRGRTTSASLVLDAAGRWKARVRAPDGLTGPCVVRISHSRPPLVVFPEPAPGLPRRDGSLEPGAVHVHEFLGHVGQRGVVSLKPRPSPLEVTVLRPGGVPLGESDVDSRGRFRLDEAGTWQVRLRNPTEETPAYRLEVRLGKPRPAPEVEPDTSGAFQLVFAAQAGASVRADVDFHGSAPSFLSFRDPDGATVPVDAAALRFRRSRLTLGPVEVPAGRPLGSYTLEFAAAESTSGITARALVRPPKREPLRQTFDEAEPLLLSVSSRATALSRVTFDVRNLVDPSQAGGTPRGFVGRHELLHPVSLEPGLQLLGGGTMAVGLLPSGVRLGRHDAAVASTSGQVAAVADAVEVLDPPRVDAVEPATVSVHAGVRVEVHGANFHPTALSNGILLGRTPPLSAADDLGLTLLQPDVEPGRLAFDLPAFAGDGRWWIAVIDKSTGAVSNAFALEVFDVALVQRLDPPLVPSVLPDEVRLRGLLFSPTDRVLLETTDPGEFEDLTAGAATYVSPTEHRILPPSRPPGRYRVRVVNEAGAEAPAPSLVYFTFADLTAQTGLSAQVGPGETFDAWTTALADFDGDGDVDLFLSRRGGAAKSAGSETRVLRNDGAGGLTDATAQVMPPVAADDDWRADRMRVVDVTEDGRPDLVLLTNSTSVLASTRSHLRILVNEAAVGGGPSDRVFRDRTADLMPPPRLVARPGGAGIADEWRGLDLWVGDLDPGEEGPPGILIVHDESKEELDAFCGNYCLSPYGTGILYSSYWGAARAFRWDESRRGGLGQFRFAHDFFPRRSGVVVPLGAPPGVDVGACDSATPCRGTFTPFAGQRLVVERIDTDDRPDVAVLSRDVVHRGTTEIPSLQVLLRVTDPKLLENADLTDALDGLGDLRGDALAVTRIGGVAVIAVAKASGTEGPALRILEASADGRTYTDVTAAALPPGAADPWNASALRFADVDEDGDQDLVLLAAGAPAGGGSALRILRNESGLTGPPRFGAVLVAPLDDLSAGGEAYAGESLTLGDLDGDGLFDYVVTRPGSTSGPDTRAVRTAVE